jgi:class 3 adenylate cyclase
MAAFTASGELVTIAGRWMHTCSVGDAESVVNLLSEDAALGHDATMFADSTAIAESAGEPRLQIRIGLHTGDLVEQEGDVFGTVVNKAARVASSAAPSEIRLSEATRIMVGTGEFGFSDKASVARKGLEGEHVIHKLDWQP